MAMRRLAAAADLAGNADGIATSDEIQDVGAKAVTRPTVGADLRNSPGVQHTLLSQASEGFTVQTLDPQLQSLPGPLRRLALEIDGLWGNADGEVSVDELDRVAKHYLAALPFFTSEAEAILELAEHLGYATTEASSASLIELRAALKIMDPDEAKRGASFRALFDEALAECDVPGVPELLRSAAEHSPRWHNLSVLEHTAIAVRAIRDIGIEMNIEWRDAGAVMLLHDIGKVLRREMCPVSEMPVYTFRGHEEVGANWLASRGLDAELVFLVRHHGDLRWNSSDEILKACGDNKKRVTELMLVFVADHIAKGDRPEQLESFGENVATIRKMAKVAGVDVNALFAVRAALIEDYFGTSPPES